MIKKKKKCIKCGYKIALATVSLFDVEVEFDQEPYEADIIEPVIINGQHEESIFLEISLNLHVCSKCGWIKDLSLERT